MCLESFSWIRGSCTLARRGRNSSQRKIGSWSRDTEPLAQQLQLPQKFFDWRTEANARSLWEQSEEMIAPFRVA